MQHTVPAIPYRRSRLRAAGAIAALGVAALVAFTGCGGTPAVTTATRPHAGAALVLNCPDPAFAAALDPMLRSWEARTGAKVAVAREPMAAADAADAADLAVVPAADLGRWAEADLLAPLPARLRAADHPFRWAELLPPYSERLVAWGDKAYAVPLTGDGFVLVYRGDRFADPKVQEEFKGRFNRPLALPATWEQFAEVAEFFAARDGKPSLPPLPADPGRLFDLFSRVASSFDRPALSLKDLDAGAKGAGLLAFQFDLPGGAPRVGGALGFRRAAEWLAGLSAAKALPAGGPDDPAAALADGRAVLAVLSLDQLARLPREGGAVPPRFGLAGVPGARGPTADAGTNYVPHFAGGRVGVVRARCPQPDLAFDLLAELGGPARGAELIATPGLGAGPTRATHLTPERLVLWLGYGFDEARSRALQDALRQYLADPVKNPTFGLRGPDREGLTAAAAGPLRTLAAGTKPADALAALGAAWAAHDAKAADRDALARWRRRAAGLD